ncbi:hypothetical protein AAHC03_017175 [Spirometra sp. Aus1]
MKKRPSDSSATQFGESLNDGDLTKLAKAPICASPEDDDQDSGTEQPANAGQSPPVTFALYSTTSSDEPATQSVTLRNHSLDMESEEAFNVNTDITNPHRTYPNMLSVKTRRASARLMASYNPISVRRGSLIVRSARPLPLGVLSGPYAAESGTSQTFTGTSPNGPTTPDASHPSVERFLNDSNIVTPYAQILAGLRSVQSNIYWLTTHSRTGTSSQTNIKSDAAGPPPAEEFERLSLATQKELEWCLQQLENIQTKRPVSDMASTKFKRLLSQKLGNFGSSDKTRSQISEYISKTFMDEFSEQEDAPDHKPEDGDSEGLVLKRASIDSSNEKVHFHLARTQVKIESRSSTEGTQSVGSVTFALRPSDSLKTPTSVEPEKRLSSRRSSWLPYHGINTENDEKLRNILEESLDTWSLNIFTVDELSSRHALTVVAYRIFSNRDLFNNFNIDPATFVNYILRLEAAYQISNPYHNHVHAADVLQAVHVLLQAETLEGVFSDLEILSVLFASAIHDANHPGLTNQYLINTGHKLALLYNDISVLENHHLSVAFKLLTEPGCDIFASLGTKPRQSLRRLVIELVLATDMSKHVNLLAELRTMVETKELAGTGFLSLDDHNDRSLVLQCMLHCSDLNSCTRSFDLYQQWTYRVMEEFFQQGDKEKAHGIEVSAMCDRDSVSIDKCQIGFFDFVLRPLWETWCDLVHPAAEHMLEALDSNRNTIQAQSPFAEFEKRSKTPGKESESTAEKPEDSAST